MFLMSRLQYSLKCSLFLGYPLDLQWLGFPFSLPNSSPPSLASVSSLWRLMQKQQRSEHPLFLTPARVASMGNCGFKFFSTCSLLPEHHDPKLGLQGDQVKPFPTSPRSSNQPMDQSRPTLRKRGAAANDPRRP